MGVLFNFERLIRKYRVSCELISAASSGSYIGGEWKADPEKSVKMISGAVIPMTAKKIYQSGGTYTEHDREFITLEEIPLEPTHYVLYKNLKYQVQESTDYFDYAGFYVYNLKRVEVFDR